MKNKIAMGIAGFFLGLLIIFVSLYFDQLQGATASSSIGIFQIIGVFIGYMAFGIGVVLVWAVDIRTPIRNILYIGGAITVVVSAFADSLGIAGPQGFDWYQIIGIVLGVLFIGAGFYPI